MNTIKFLTFTDVHISDNNPAFRSGNYKEDILNKLGQIGKVGKKLGVDFYLFAGDMFHLKPPSRNSHSLNNNLIQIFRGYGAPIYTTEGNHDIRYDSYETFEEQPLSVLYASNVLHQIRDKIISINNCRIKLQGIPFQENPDLSKIKEKDTDYDLKISILHLYAGKKGGKLFKQKIFSYDELSSLNSDIYVLGHYHIDQGVEKINKNNKNQFFVNIGAISRGTTSEDDITRNPKICYVKADLYPDSTPEIKTQIIKLNVKPVSEIFNLEEKKKENENIRETEIFVEELKKEINSVESNVDIIEKEIERTNLESNIIKKVKYYLSEADLKIKEMK